MEENNKILELENKINVLEERIRYLEKCENKRKIKRIIQLVIKFILLLIIIIGLYKSYIYIKENYIVPYKDTIDKINNSYNDIKDYDFSNIFNFN